MRGALRLSYTVKISYVTEPVAIKGGGAARYGARLIFLLAAVCDHDTMLESWRCWGGASIKFHYPCTIFSFTSYEWRNHLILMIPKLTLSRYTNEEYK